MKLIKVTDLATGYVLYKKPNTAGGYTYLTDEFGVGCLYLDTCLHDISIFDIIKEDIAKNGAYPVDSA